MMRVIIPRFRFLQENIAKQIEQIMELENLEEVCLTFHISHC